MSRELITLTLPCPADANAGDAVQVYTDEGSGTIDYNAPLLPRPMPLFPGRTRRRGTLDELRLGADRLVGPDAARKTTLRDAPLGATTIGDESPVITVAVPVKPGYENWKFAAKVVDEAGNIQSAAAPEVTARLSATRPPSIRRFKLDGYDAGSDTITFSVTTNAES